MSLELPRVLQPWAELLHLFPHDNALALGTLLRRLAIAIGPMQLDPLLGQDEPDGYSGLHNRGDYQRLLLSEWLLAEQEPDEFMRRAIMGEQLFYQPLRLDNKASKASVVLFDSGPAQLGSARIVQLALLILLARRAQAAGAEFYWGVLQKPDTGLIAQITTGQIQRWLRTRTLQFVSSEHITPWQSQLNEIAGIAELWLVSPHLAEQLIASDRCIVIEEALIPAQRQVNVSVLQNHRWHQIRLDLPDEKSCTRLLRDPFKSVSTTPVGSAKRIADSGSLLFSQCGRKLAVLLEDGTVAVYPVPNSARQPASQPRLFTPASQEQLLALQMLKKRIHALTSDGHSMIHHYLSGVRGESLAVHEDMSISPELETAVLAPCFFSSQAGFPHSVFFLDHASTLWCVAWPLTSTDFNLVAEGVLAMSYLNGAIHYIEQQDEQCFLVCRTNSSQPQRLPLEVASAASMEFHFGHANSWLQHDVGLLAYNNGVQQWALRSDDSTCVMDIFPDESIVGTLRLAENVFSGQRRSFDDEQLPCLVLLNQSDNSLHIQHNHQRIAVPHADNVTAAVIEPRYQQIAFTHHNGEISVYSTERNELVLRVTPTATDP